MTWSPKVGPDFDFKSYVIQMYNVKRLKVWSVNTGEFVKMNLDNELGNEPNFWEWSMAMDFCKAVENAAFWY